MWPQSLPPKEQQELLCAIARLAIDFVSGPGGTLECWWAALGSLRYPGAARLLVTANSGGSNAARSRAHNKHPAAFAGRHGPEEVTVLRYPAGTSKWNKVEHRLFSLISINWRGKPLTSYETVANSSARPPPRPA